MPCEIGAVHVFHATAAAHWEVACCTRLLGVCGDRGSSAHCPWWHDDGRLDLRRRCRAPLQPDPSNRSVEPWMLPMSQLCTLSDDVMLARLQRAAFGYFVETMNPINGLIPD